MHGAAGALDGGVRIQVEVILLGVHDRPVHHSPCSVHILFRDIEKLQPTAITFILHIHPSLRDAILAFQHRPYEVAMAGRGRYKY